MVEGMPGSQTCIDPLPWLPRSVVSFYKTQHAKNPLPIFKALPLLIHPHIFARNHKNDA